MAFFSSLTFDFPKSRSNGNTLLGENKCKQEKSFDFPKSRSNGNSTKPTNAKRAHRLDWLEKVAAVGAEKWMAWYLQVPLETCLERNLARDRQVPEGVIRAMAASLEGFPPDNGEGLVTIEKIGEALTMDGIRARIAGAERNIEMQARRRSKYELHRYSRLLDFERLMHLMSLLLEYPGVGNLEHINPEALRIIFGNDEGDRLPLFIYLFIVSPHSPPTLPHPHPRPRNGCHFLNTVAQ